MAFLKTHPAVKYVEPNYILHAATVPSDPQFGDLWGLQNTGQDSERRRRRHAGGRCSRHGRLGRVDRVDGPSRRKAIRGVMAGEYWIGRESVSGLVETLRTQMVDPHEPTFGLTPRELEIISAVTAGYGNREIAKRFSLSQETVKHHLTKIFGKLRVSNRLESRSLPSTSTSRIVCVSHRE